MTQTVDTGPTATDGDEDRPKAGRISRGLGWSTASNLTLRVGNFCVSLIMARLIAPNEFGVFAVALTVWTILSTLAEFGLNSALVRAADFDRRAPTVATLGLASSVLLGGAMVLGAPLIAASFTSPESAGPIRVMAISVVIFGFSTVQLARLVRDFRQGTLFVVNAAALLASTGTLIVLALDGWGAMALAVGQIVSQVVMVAGHFIATRRPLRLGFDPAVAREVGAFCLPLAGANLLSWLLLSVDNVVVARVLSPTELGLYMLAFNVSSWPMSALGQAVRSVALPAFAQVGGVERWSRALSTIIAPLWAVALLVGVGLATLAQPVIVLLYGDRWSAAAAALAGLGLFGAVRVLFDLFATALIALGSTRAVLVVQVIWFVVMIPAMYAGVLWFGLAGAGWSHLAIAVVVVLPAYLVCLRRHGVAIAPLLRRCLVPTLTAVPLAAVGVALAHWLPWPLLCLAAALVCAVAFYALPLHRWWLDQLHILRTLPSADPVPSTTESLP